MHKAFILLVHFQPRPPRVLREGGRDFTFVLLSEGKCKTRPALSSLKPGYLKPALSVKICYQNLHLRKKKKKKKEKPCENKCNSIDDQVFFNCALAPTVAVFHQCPLTFITSSSLTTHVCFYLMLFCFSTCGTAKFAWRKKGKLGATYLCVAKNTRLRAQICQHTFKI